MYKLIAGELKKGAPLVLWGFHPEHGNTPLKLEGYSASALKRRRNEGWMCAGYAQGDEPIGLLLLAKGKAGKGWFCLDCGLDLPKDVANAHWDEGHVIEPTTAEALWGGVDDLCAKCGDRTLPGTELCSAHTQK